MRGAIASTQSAGAGCSRLYSTDRAMKRSRTEVWMVALMASPCEPPLSVSARRSAEPRRSSILPVDLVLRNVRVHRRAHRRMEARGAEAIEDLEAPELVLH